MTRLTLWVGVLVTISVGVAATVLAQTAPNRDKTQGGTTPAALAPITAETGVPPVFEFEIKIWKDGVPVATPAKVMAIPGERSLFVTTEGTVELRFHPRSESLKKFGDSSQPKMPDGDPRHRPDGDPRMSALAAARDRVAQDTLLQKQHTAKLLNDALLAEQLARKAVTDKVRAEVLAQRLRGVEDPIINQVGLGAVERESSANDDHEKRLAEIERKLERILSVLEPKPATTRETREVR